MSFSYLFIEERKMVLGDGFVSDSVKHLSERGIVFLSIIFFEFYDGIGKIFFESHRIEESFAGIIITEFLFSFLVADWWQLEDISDKYHGFSSKRFFDQGIIACSFG